MQFKGKVVLVTGASSGIGQAIAVQLAQQGAEIYVGGRRESAIAETIRLCKAAGGRAHAAAGDVAVEADVLRIAESIHQQHEALDLLVNSAGITLIGYSWETPVADWRALLDINVMGTVHTCRAFLPAMIRRRQGGWVVNVSSISGLMGVPLNSAYCASKHAVTGLSDAMRRELKPQRIGVTLVCPGTIKTPIQEVAKFVGAADGTKVRQAAARMFKLSRLDADDVARATLRAVQARRKRLILGMDAVSGVLTDRTLPFIIDKVLGDLPPPLALVGDSKP